MNLGKNWKSLKSLSEFGQKIGQVLKKLGKFR